MIASSVRLRPLLLPVEHGGWGFLLEPIVIGLAAAPSMAGGWLALAALAGFLSRQPLKVAADDWRRARRVPRTAVAWWAATGYLLVAALVLAAAALLARASIWPLAAAVAPLAVVTLWFDSRGASRQLLPEICGAAALAAVAAATARATGWPWPPAVALWLTALVRVVPAIVTVRERVRRLHGYDPRAAGPAMAHGLALAAAVYGYVTAVMPPGILVIAMALAVRAAWELRPQAPAEPAQRIGLRELVTGLAAAAAIGLVWRGHVN